jgi:hypothetical protein
VTSPVSGPVKWLRILLWLTALFHLMTGLGLMFSVDFQKLAVTSYGARIPWDDRDVYFIRIVGSFAFVLGYLAAMAARDPVRHSIVVVAFIEFFVLRNINRHLYSRELYSGFGVAPVTNDLTTLFFGIQAVLLAALLWRAPASAAGQPRSTSRSPA